VVLGVPRSQHRALRLYALEHDTDASKVIRAVVDELAGGGELGEAVARRLRS
jgi:hypothetical protein